MGSIEQEKLTVQKMINLYCRKKHRTAQLCEECSLLMKYAIERLSKCPFGDDKGKCANCSIHCYKPDLRLKVIAVMRFSGSRMFLYHPGIKSKSCGE